MRDRLLTITAATLCALAVSLAFAPSTARTRTLDETATGVDGEALSTARTTDSIPIGNKAKSVIVQFFVTTTTTTDVTIYCEDSIDGGSTWALISHTTNAAASTGARAVLTYDVSTYTDYSFQIEHPAPLLRCTFEDLADGDGTIKVLMAVTE